jgi:hypothetical protein
VQHEKNKALNLAPLFAVLFGLIVVFHLGNALTGNSLFRAQHLGAALEYGRGRINLLRPVIIGFNATGTPTPQELPVWQAAAGLVFKITGSTWYGWANLVSLLLFVTGLWPFFQLARRYVGERPACWTLVFFLAQPLVVVYAGKASTDGFCLMVTIWFLFFCGTDDSQRPSALVAASGVVRLLGSHLQAPVFHGCRTLQRFHATDKQRPVVAVLGPVD